jgi:hypothetical protein
VLRIVRLGSTDENDPLTTSPSAFTQAPAGLGWTDGRNVRMDPRWYGDDTNRVRTPPGGGAGERSHPRAGG